MVVPFYYLGQMYYTFWMQITLFRFMVTLLTVSRLVFPQADSSSLPAVPTQTSIARATTRLVQISVVVQDRRGRPIKDLRQEDFHLTENGKAQKVSFFSIESNRKAVGRGTTLPADTFSNMPSQSGASENLTVILFDMLNTPMVNRANARDEVIRFLQQIETQDRVAIYGLGNTLQILHDFTGNSESMLRAVRRYKAPGTVPRIPLSPSIDDSPMSAFSGPEQAIMEMMDKFLSESNRIVADQFIERRMAITLDALEAVAYHLIGLPGRKNLVWVSGSIPFAYGSDTFDLNRANPGMKNFSAAITRASRAINHANMSIYPVDARGFMGVAEMNPSSTAESGLTGGVRQLNQRRDMNVADEVLSSQNTMQELAEKTGGRAIYNQSDVNGAIQGVLEESRWTYTLGYYPADTRFDNKFRSIKVSMDRPDVRLRYRRGYYAVAEEPADSARRQNAINAAAVRLLDATAVGFSVSVGKPETGSSIRPFTMDVDPGSVTLEKVQDVFVGGLDAVFVQFDGTGNILTSIGRTVPIRLTSEQREQLLKDGLVLNAPLDIQGQCERLRFILRDVNTGAIGTLTVPLK